jgi:hypothetical protein
LIPTRVANLGKGDSTVSLASRNSIQSDLNSRTHTRHSSLANTSTLMQMMGAGTWTAANRKRNQDFHALFPQLDQHELLIEDFNCALQKEILVQGRLYLSEKHLCFYANIFGWVTNMVIPMMDMLAVEKKNTAFVIPNAILVMTKDAKLFFASFLFRDSCFQLMVDTWKRARAVHAAVATTSGQDPSAVSNLVPLVESANIVHLSTYADNGGSTASASVVTSPTMAPHGGDISHEEIVWEDEDALGLDEDDDGSIVESEGDANDSVHVKTSPRNRFPPHLRPPIRTKSYSDTDEPSSRTTRDARPATSHPLSPIEVPTIQENLTPAQCTCDVDGLHATDPVILDQVLPFSVTDVRKLVYGDESPFFVNFLQENQHCKEVQIGKWENNVRHLQYIIPLNNAIGPKQAKTFVTETITQDDSSVFTLISESKTPEVPAGGSFITRGRMCLVRGTSSNETHMRCNVKVDFIKSTWLRGPIEKGTLEGMGKFYAAFIKELEATISPKMPVKTARVSKKKTRTAVVNGVKAAVVEALPTPTPTKLLWMDRFNLQLNTSQMMLIIIILLCTIANLWCWRRILELEYLVATDHYTYDRPQDPLDMPSRLKLANSISRLRQLDERAEKVSQVMMDAERELTQLTRELELERSHLSDLMLEGMKQGLSRVQPALENK